MSVLDQLLSESEYLVDDDFSVADVAVAAYLCYVPLFFPSVRLNSPNIVAYMRRCAERPAFAKAFGGGHANAVLAACESYHAKREAQHWLAGTGQESAATLKVLGRVREARGRRVRFSM